MTGKIKVLMVHNYYQRRGGEDEQAEQDARLLERFGHPVRLYSRHNDEIKEFSAWKKGLLFLEPTWSARTYREISQLIRTFKPDVVHVHNFFPLITPSVFYACTHHHVPTVLTLHDYRLLCPIGWFFRKGAVCEECVTHSLLRGIRYGCYHNSSLQTASITLLLKTHRLLKTWQNKVDLYIALTSFSRQKFIQAGIPEAKIVIRPNFIIDVPNPSNTQRKYAVFVGRLSEEKGLTILVEAWKHLHSIPLKIIGDGPLRPWLEDYIAKNHMEQVELVGFLPLQEIFDYVGQALFLVMPSIWYETFGRTIIEAFATGTPVIASRIGAITDLVSEGENGLLFTAGDPQDLAKKVQWALDRPQELQSWGQKARSVFENRYSAQSAYQSSIRIYQQAIEK